MPRSEKNQKGKSLQEGRETEVPQFPVLYRGELLLHIRALIYQWPKKKKEVIEWRNCVIRRTGTAL